MEKEEADEVEEEEEKEEEKEEEEEEEEEEDYAGRYAVFYPCSSSPRYLKSQRWSLIIRALVPKA